MQRRTHIERERNISCLNYPKCPCCVVNISGWRQRVVQVSLPLKSYYSFGLSFPIWSQPPVSLTYRRTAQTARDAYTKAESLVMMECCSWRNAMAPASRCVLLQPAGAGARRRLLLPAQALWGTERRRRRRRLVSFEAPPRCHKMYVPGNCTCIFALILIALSLDGKTIGTIGHFCSSTMYKYNYRPAVSLQ